MLVHKLGYVDVAVLVSTKQLTAADGYGMTNNICSAGQPNITKQTTCLHMHCTASTLSLLVHAGKPWSCSPLLLVRTIHWSRKLMQTCSGGQACLTLRPTPGEPHPASCPSDSMHPANMLLAHCEAGRRLPGDIAKCNQFFVKSRL